MPESTRPTQMMDVERLKSAPRNAKLHDEPGMQASFDEFGFGEPLLLDERTKAIVAGHGRRDGLIARKRAEGEPPDGVDVRGKRWLVPVVRGWRSRDDDHALRAGIYFNKLGEGLWDQRILFEELDRLAATDEGLGATGFDTRDLDKMRRELDAAGRPAIAEDADLWSVFPYAEVEQLAFDHYREHGYPYRDVTRHVGMQEINRLAVTADHVLASTSVGNRIADRFHHHRFSEGSADGWKSRIEVFESEKGLRKILDLCRQWDQLIDDALVYTNSGFAIGARTLSNFRPGFALLMARKYGRKGGTWLDCSTGFGGRLVAFCASDMKRYVGIDPSLRTVSGNEQLAQWYAGKKDVQLIAMPAEDVDAQLVKSASCDFAFTSPPYFDKERYAQEPTQSFMRYPQPEQWRDGFLRPFIELQWRALKRGRFAVVNIANVRDNPSDETSIIPLETWTVDIAKQCGFEHVSVEQYPLSRVPNHQGDERRFEPAFVFLKP